MADDAFSLLARPIQHALWDMGWESLRPIQEEGIREISRGNRDIIIAARTAAGKTEAAFLPILSRVFEHPQPSVQALYVGPLRALINDQFRRLEELCRRAEIPVHRWHGDVDGGKKKALLRSPSGILLITPESIESLFINHSSAIPRLVRHLRHVVIDEIHALVGSERGTHLRSLLYRLNRNATGDFRTVGLSATLGGAFDDYKYWLRPNEPESVLVISDAGEKKRILYRVHAYSTGDRAFEHAEDRLPAGIVEEMYDHLAGSKNLLFANTKQDVEWFADSLNRRCEQLGRPKEFLVHHGSLSKEIREFTEQEMQGRRPQTTACSSTLELGIDIGNVTSVGQVDPPWSVSSLVQRLGRSGRGDDEPQCMRVYVREIKCSAKSSLEKRLYPGLLRTIAVTELMLETPSWVEPPSIDLLDFSTLTQQILSVLGETGGTPLEFTLCDHDATGANNQFSFGRHSVASVNAKIGHGLL
jgi:ATP-dependent Lhr-like helicase